MILWHPDHKPREPWTWETAVERIEATRARRRAADPPPAIDAAAHARWQRWFLVLVALVWLGAVFWFGAQLLD